MIYSLSFFRSDASGYESDDAGSSQGVFFKRYMLPTVRAFLAVYGDTDTKLWIHHDQRVKDFDCFKVLEVLQDRGYLKLIDCGEATHLCEAMLWRMKPVWDTDEIVVCRDIDSLPMPRERLMLEEFAATDLMVHALLDSESHTGPLMGGMIAIRGWRPAPTWDDFIYRYNLASHGSDQACLNDWWRKIRPSTLVHQRAELTRYPGNVRAAAPIATPGDELVYHIGAPYPIEKCVALYPNAELDALEDALLTD